MSTLDTPATSAATLVLHTAPGPVMAVKDLGPVEVGGLIDVFERTRRWTMFTPAVLMALVQGFFYVAPGFHLPKAAFLALSLAGILAVPAGLLAGLRAQRRVLDAEARELGLSAPDARRVRVAIEAQTRKLKGLWRSGSGREAHRHELVQGVVKALSSAGSTDTL